MPYGNELNNRKAPTMDTTKARPATPKQMRFARKLAREGNRVAPPKDLSITEASRLIDALLNTNRGWALKPDELGARRPLPPYLTDADVDEDDGCIAAEAANERYFEERGSDIPF